MPGAPIRILITPLDWGLGHATRCIPVIRELLRLNCEVLIASDKQTGLLLKKEFPTAGFLKLKGYEIKYSHKKNGFSFKILLQFPKILRIIIYEHKWLKKAVREYKIDAVISDNRFGMYHKKIPDIYITHQLSILAANTFSEKIARKVHNYFISRYTRCWVPDFEIDGLAGILSHPQKNLSNVIYIGPLSRFEKLKNTEITYDLLITISGPEPQRTIFEEMIVLQLKNFQGKALLVRGLPGDKGILNQFNESIKIVNHLPADELNKTFEQSKMIISRSGYTTIMDLIKLQKAAILVPTPGQTEQEYLAKYLSERKLFYSVDQNSFSLNDALKDASHFSFTKIDFYCEGYKKVIYEFVASLKTGNFAAQ